MASKRRRLPATVIAAAMLGSIALLRAPAAVGGSSPVAPTPAASARTLPVPRTKTPPLIPIGVAAGTEPAAVVVARFREQRRCYAAWSDLESWNRLQEACRDIAHYGPDAATQASCQGNVEAARPQMLASRRALSGCPGAGVIAMRYHDAARQAAMVGDHDAQACYLQDLFDNPDRTPLIASAHDLAGYQRVAPRYLAEGLARGDWRTVALLAEDFVDGSSFLPLVASQKPMDKYVMQRLLQLGADAGYAHELELEIQGVFLASGNYTTPVLTPRQAVEGTARARSLYHRYFQHSPRLAAAPIPCPRI